MHAAAVFLTLAPRVCASSTHFPPVMWSQRKGSISVTVPLYDAQQLSFAFSNLASGHGSEFQFSCIGCFTTFSLPAIVMTCEQASERRTPARAALFFCLATFKTNQRIKFQVLRSP
jgi:hypothetical protein